ncbi:unnamed protein product, partial [Prorocentrum cordatum]
MAETLDTYLIQVCIDFPDDPNIRWRRVVLLFELGPGRWVASTPDFGVEVVDLANHRVAPLSLATRWPERARGNVYGHGPLSEEQKEDILLRGLQLARVLGHKVTPSASAGAARRWRVSDPGHVRFNSELEDADMLPGNRAVGRGGCGLYLIDEEEEDWVSVERVPNRRLDMRLERKRGGPGRDLRIHPIQRDSAGRRSALLKESVNMFKVAKFEDWPFDGPSAADEVLSEVAKAGLELHLYPTWWESKSGVNPQSSVAREVRLCFDYLRCFQSHDQLNLPALSGVESICRRVIVCQQAVERNPKNPDFSGFEGFLQASFDDSGGLRTTEFDKYMAESQKTDATVLEQFRLWQEELEADKKRQVGAGSPDERRVMVTNAVSALNGLAGARAGRPLQLRRPGYRVGGPSDPQRSILGRVARRVDDVFPAPDDFDAKNSLFALMKCKDMYKVGDATSLAPMALERLKIMKGDTTPKDALGLVGGDAQERVKSFIGLFAVLKKDGALTGLDVSADSLGVLADGLQLCGCSVDFQDGFYQLRYLPLSDWFGIPIKITAGGAGISDVYDSVGGQDAWGRVEPGERVWPCFCGVAMGWSWGLYICRSALTDGLIVAVGRMMACSREVAERQLARDGFPAPCLSKGRPVIAPYVDNGNVVRYDVADAKQVYKEMVSELVSRGFTLRDLVEFDEDLDMVGFVLSGSDKCWKHRRSRFCILQECYQFVQESIGRFRRFSDAVVSELRTCQGVLPLVVARLSDPFYEKAFISNSSTLGYALHQGYFSGAELRAVGRWKERWRFADEEEDLGLGLEANGPGLDADFDCLGESFDLDEVPRGAPHRPEAAGAAGARPRSVKPEMVTGIVPALPDKLLDGARWSSVGDNLSEIMATEKGRAVDHGLNALCRRAAALQLGAEIRWVRRYVESEHNPTDADSRLADKGVLKAGEALRPGRLAGRLRAAAASRAAAPVQTAEGRGPSCARSERQTRRPLGILELFVGCGRLSGACAQAGLRILCPIDVANGKHFDLLNSRVQRRVIRWIREGRVWHVHLAPPCTRWSHARSTGSEDSNEVTRGLKLALFSCRVLRVCRQCEVTVSVENPASSGIWAYEPLKRELHKCSCSPARYDSCRYGAPFKKPTIFCASAVSLGALDRRCSCRVPHEILEGK